MASRQNKAIVAIVNNQVLVKAVEGIDQMLARAFELLLDRLAGVDVEYDPLERDNLTVLRPDGVGAVENPTPTAVGAAYAIFELEGLADLEIRPYLRPH